MCAADCGGCCAHNAVLSEPKRRAVERPNAGADCIVNEGVVGVVRGGGYDAGAGGVDDGDAHCGDDDVCFCLWVNALLQCLRGEGEVVQAAFLALLQ